MPLPRQGRPSPFPRARANYMFPEIIIRRYLNKIPSGERSEEIARIFCENPRVRAEVGEEEIAKLEKALEDQRQKRIARLADLEGKQ